MQGILARFAMSYANVEPKRSVAKQVSERASSGVCLIDDCGGEAHTRGLCQSHYGVFYHTLNGIKGESEQLEFESEAIRNGLILPPQKVRAFTRNNPFTIGGDKS